MRAWWFVGRRVLWTAFAAWLLLSGTFFVYAYTPDPNEHLAEFAAGYAAAQQGEDPQRAAEEATRAYREARDRDRPVLDRYVRWVVAYATLDWGLSNTETTTGGDPSVTAIVAERGVVSLAYLLPALVLATLGGVAVGLYSATMEGTLGDSVGSTAAYALLGVPNFWFAEVLFVYALTELSLFGIENWSPGGVHHPDNQVLLALAGIVVGTNVLAVQARYARAESREYVPAAFVRTLRSTGASAVSVGRHVLRNAAIPLVSLLFTDVLVLVMITVFVVEVVLGIPGLGKTMYDAIENRDIGLVLGTTMIPVLVVLVGNLLQDVAYVALDPRIDFEE